MRHAGKERKQMEILFDIHTHSLASGHGSMATVNDMAREAAKRGLPLLGITEHAPAMSGACKESYFKGIALSERRRFGIELLFGAELNILNYNGSVDLSIDTLKKLDVSIASLHPQCLKPGTRAENTAAYIGAMKNPYISIIGHPDDEKYDINYEDLVLAARQNRVLFEINNTSLSPDGYRGDAKSRDLVLLHYCMKYQAPVILGSDSHGTKHIGDFTYAKKLLQELNFPNTLVVNYNKAWFFDIIKR